MKKLSLGLLLTLSMCATFEQPSGSTCLQLKNWTEPEQKELENDLEALPDNSLLIPAFSDYWRMRNETKFCNGV